jgi:hypothetical protein
LRFSACPLWANSGRYDTAREHLAVADEVGAGLAKVLIY